MRILPSAVATNIYMAAQARQPFSMSRRDIMAGSGSRWAAGSGIATRSNSPRYDAAGDIGQYLCGTPPVLGMVALDAALDIRTA